MIGAIIGDVIGSRFERSTIKSKDFDLFHSDCKFTDDSVLTIATAEAILDNTYDYQEKYVKYGKKYPDAGYGKMFKEWIKNPFESDSWGNGASMRISPIGWSFEDTDIIIEARKSAKCSHNNIDAICCANLVAYCIYMSIEGYKKSEIRDVCKTISPYNFDRTVDSIRPSYNFSSRAATSVPEAIICFLESESFEDAIRLAISLGGDADTQASIAGAIAEAYYDDIPEWIVKETLKYIPNTFVDIIYKFKETYTITSY
jgi:ADP-ribosylglycohydrolase